MNRQPSLASRIALVLMMLGLLPLAFGFSLQPVPVLLPPLRRDNGPQHGLRMVDTPQPQPETVDRFLAKYAWNPLRRNVYALLKPVCTRRRSRAPARLLSHVSFFDLARHARDVALEAERVARTPPSPRAAAFRACALKTRAKTRRRSPQNSATSEPTAYSRHRDGVVMAS